MTSNKIKIVIATNIFDIGGAERTVQTLALYLDKSKFDVTVLCLERGGSRVKLLEEKGVRILIGNGTLEKIKELMPNPDIDILHFHRSGQFEQLHQAATDYLRPKKLMETNVFAFSDPNLGPKFDLQIFKSMMMVSERIWQGKQAEQNKCLKQRVIYNPVTISYFQQFQISPERRQALREAVGVKSDEILLGRIGRNDPVKWGDLVLSALPDIFKINNKIKILFRTIPASRLNWLKKHHFFDGRVIVLPESSLEQEIAETYQMLDIYIHTSRRGEAFGNSLNEAMVWSLPIVVENTPHWDNGQLEQVENGKTGWVVHSVGGLTAAIADLAGKPQHVEAFGKAGREKVEKSFGLPVGIRQYELAYEQLAGIVPSSEVLKQIFPSAEMLLEYGKQYQKLSRLDFSHSQNISSELRRKVLYWYWRVLDSLISRGFVKLKKQVP
ncbi:MAG: glycosyltransferase family 4 protein [Candidatus Magasanikbacteria bacterium]|nr:glycosyltransferase family 4 protein [Candidatus Magasanikbacteria bacterium]